MRDHAAGGAGQVVGCLDGVAVGEGEAAQARGEGFGGAGDEGEHFVGEGGEIAHVREVLCDTVVEML